MVSNVSYHSDKKPRILHYTDPLDNLETNQQNNNWIVLEGLSEYWGHTVDGHNMGTTVLQSDQDISQHFCASHFLWLLSKLTTNFKKFALDKSIEEPK